MGWVHLEGIGVHLEWIGVQLDWTGVEPRASLNAKTNMCVCLCVLGKLDNFDNKCTTFIQNPIKFETAERDSHFLSASF